MYIYYKTLKRMDHRYLEILYLIISFLVMNAMKKNQSNEKEIICRKAEKLFSNLKVVFTQFLFFYMLYLPTQIFRFFLA